MSNSNKINQVKASINRLSPGLNFKDFESIDTMNAFVQSVQYENDLNNQICFSLSLIETNGEYDISLHYFDSNLRLGIKDIPNNLVKTVDFFQTTPNFEYYDKWHKSGFLQIKRIIYEIILKDVTKNSEASIEFGMLPYKFLNYYSDTFGNLIAGIVPFFLIIAYNFPLCLLIFRMVKEKETKAREGMKIMGLSEKTYFLSFFIQYLIMNTIYAILNSLILTRLFTYIKLGYIFGFFWLFGMTVFSMGYFFQSLMDKTRIAIIMSILIYFIMYFVSVVVISEDVQNVVKMIISLLPPTCLQLGLSTLAKFEGSGIYFGSEYINYSYNNFSVGNMYLMFFIDFFVYLFLGYYCENVITHQYGIKKPWYFLCTKSFWCTKKKTKIIDVNVKELDNVVKINVSGTINRENFQDERNYEDKIKQGAFMNIKDLKKVFDDGKVAVDGLNLTLYKDEIFALLGHNGAGKSTTISILCGLYESTSGKAYYKGENIFDNMAEFRKKVGICPQHNVLFDDLTVREHLEMFCIFKGVESNRIKHEVDIIINEIGLNEKENVTSKSLSGGQKRKLSIAIALVGGSEIVFLDEPTAGMDITSRRNLWDILKRCTNNRIIVLTTHYMEEAEVLGKRIGILSAGKLRCCGNSLFLVDRFGKYITLSILKTKDAEDDKITAFIKNKIPSIKEPERLSEEIIFRIPINGEIKTKDFFQELDKSLDLLKIKSYGASMPTLEDVFLNVASEVDNFGNL